MPQKQYIVPAVMMDIKKVTKRRERDRKGEGETEEQRRSKVTNTLPSIYNARVMCIIDLATILRIMRMQ